MAWLMHTLNFLVLLVEQLLLRIKCSFHTLHVLTDEEFEISSKIYSRSITGMYVDKLDRSTSTAKLAFSSIFKIRLPSSST